MHNRATNTYRRIDLASAPKEQIVDKLFTRFLGDVEIARAAIVAKDVHGKAAALDHALQIVGELQAALDHVAAPELCANLAGLYGFVTQRLTEASLARSTTPLDQAVRIMTELGAAFREAPSR